MSIDVTTYLERIGCNGSLAPTAESLRALHRAHLRAVPGEGHGGGPADAGAGARDESDLAFEQAQPSSFHRDSSVLPYAGQPGRSSRSLQNRWASIVLPANSAAAGSLASQAITAAGTSGGAPP